MDLAFQKDHLYDQIGMMYSSKLIWKNLLRPYMAIYKTIYVC